MAQPTGVNARAAVKRPAETSAYGTDAAATITNQIPILNETLTSTPEYDVEEALIGRAAPQDSDIVAWRAGGGLSVEAWYEGLEYMLLAAMGFCPPTVYTGVFGTGSGGSPAPDAATPHAWCHLFELDNSLERTPWLATDERAVSSGISTDPTYWTVADQKVRSFSTCIDKNAPDGNVHHFQDCMVRRMTFRITPQQIGFEFDLFSRKGDRTGTRDKASWAMPTNHNRLIFPQARFYVDAIGATLTTEYAIQEAELVVENSVAEDFATGANAVYPLEPLRVAFRKGSLKLKLARFATAQFNTWLDAGSNVQALLQVTGGTIPSSSKTFQMSWAVPFAKVTRAEFPVAGPGVITGDVELALSKPTFAAYAWLTTLLGGIDAKKAGELYLLLWNARPWCWSRDRQSAAAGVLP